MRCLSVHRPLQACTCSFILPRASRLLQSAAATDLPLVRPCGRRRAPPLGFRPSSRHQQAASTHARSSHAPGSRSVRGVSHALDGLLRHLPCGFVSPRSHVQGLPYRGLSLSAEPYRVSPADSCPLAVRRARLRFDPRQRPPRRLQGLAPRGECGAGERQLAPDRSAPLLGFSSSGCSPLATYERFRARSARGLRWNDPAPAGLQRLAVARIGWPGSRLPTRTRFLTCRPLLLSKVGPRSQIGRAHV